MSDNEKLGLEVGVEGFRKFNRQMGDMDSAIDRTGQRWGGLGTAAGKAAKILSTIVVSGLLAVTAAAAASAVAVANIAIESTKLAAEFQSSLTVLELSARDSGLALDELGEVALKVGGDTTLVGVSATGAADAMTNLFKAGLTTSEVFGDLNGFMEDSAGLGGALRASIDLAAASELDMVAASELAATTLSTFGGSMETAEERADFVNAALNNLVQTADASVADVSDLAAALTAVGPTAASMGFELKEVNNALGILSTRGIRGATAGTNLKSAFINLTRQTDPVIDTLKELNVSLFDSEGNMKDMRTIVSDLSDATSGLTEEQRNNAIQTLAGSFGQSALNTLLQEGVDGWDAMAEATENATTIQEQAEARSATFEGQVEALGGVVETLKIRIGDEFLPVATEFVQWAATFAEEKGPQLQAIFETIAKFLGENMPIVLETLVRFFSEDIPNAIDTTSSFWNDVLQPAIENVWTFVSENVLPVFAVLANWLQEVLPVAVQVLSDIWTITLLPTLLALQEAWEEKIQPALSKLFEWIDKNLPSAIATLVDIWNTVFVPALTLLSAFVTETLIPTLATLWEWLITNLPAALETLGMFWRDVLKPEVEEFWAFVEETVLPIIRDLVYWLKTNIPVAIQKLADFWNNILMPAVETVSQFMNDVFIPIVTALADVIGSVLTFAVEVAAAAWENRISPALKTVWAFIKDNFNPIWLELVKIFSEKIAPMFDNAKVIFDSLRNSIATVGDALQPVIQFFGDLADKIDNLEIPAWLQPGSPPPLFFALKDIAAAMGELNNTELPRFRAGLSMPVPGILSAASSVPNFAAGGGASNVSNRNTVNNFNLTTQSLTPQSGLAMEFQSMELATR